MILASSTLYLNRNLIGREISCQCLMLTLNQEDWICVLRCLLFTQPISLATFKVGQLHLLIVLIDNFAGIGVGAVSHYSPLAVVPWSEATVSARLFFLLLLPSRSHSTSRMQSVRVYRPDELIPYLVVSHHLASTSTSSRLSLPLPSPTTHHLPSLDRGLSPYTDKLWTTLNQENYSDWNWSRIKESLLLISIPSQRRLSSPCSIRLPD